MTLSGNPTNNGAVTATAFVSGLGAGQHTLYARTQDAVGREYGEYTYISEIPLAG